MEGSQAHRKSAGIEPIANLCVACTARHRGICGALDDDQLRELASRASRRCIPAGKTLQADSEEVAAYANLLQGVIKLSKTLADGRQQIVGLRFPPDFIGRPFGHESRLSAETASDVEVCTFSRSVLGDLLRRYPELERQLFRQTLAELDEAREWLLAIGRKTARERVASLLHMIAMNVPEASPVPAQQRTPAIFDLPLTRNDMADFLGLTIETVSRQLGRLRQEGIITLENNRHVTTPDMERLSDAAGD